MKTEGFVLQASYRIFGGKPVVHVYGRLADGRSFLVRDFRQQPFFYIRSLDVKKARALGAKNIRETSKTSFAKEPVSSVSVVLPSDTPLLRDGLHRGGIETFEADVRFATRYLIERNIRGSCWIQGEPVHGVEGVDCLFDDPVLVPTVIPFRPKVLSFDIETNPDGNSLLAISLFVKHPRLFVDEVVVVNVQDREAPQNTIMVADEAQAILWFIERVREIDPDILTGWNVIDFDLNVLLKVAQRCGISLNLGRDRRGLRTRRAEGYFGSGQATIAGRVVLDGIDLVRGAFLRFDDYTLDTVAKAVLGKGKILDGDVRDRAFEILNNYRTDLPAFCEYARADARLVVEILDRLTLIDLAVERSRLTGMPVDRVAASIASFDFVYLAGLQERNVVAPSVRSGDSSVFSAQAGGHVLEPSVGMHENVWIFDYKSLYPSVMRTFNIDPLSFVQEQLDGKDISNESPSKNPEVLGVIEVLDGIQFSREPAILPEILSYLFEKRQRAKHNRDDVASQAIKILMNSFYGVLGTPACRFHNPKIANAITSLGRHFLLWSKLWFEEAGYDVIYGDTDSVFVRSRMSDPLEAESLGISIARDVNKKLNEYVREKWGVQSCLELELEKLYSKLFMPAARQSTAGARKRYAGVVYGSDTTEFVGMEVVRRDWTELAKDVQRGLFDRLFAGNPVEDFLIESVKGVREGKLDRKLVYRKGVRKDLASYKRNTPPHVVAARKSSEATRVIAYMITVAGPEPLSDLRHEPDREHYVQAQIRAVSEPVLGALGLNFDRVIGDDKQLGLF